MILIGSLGGVFIGAFFSLIGVLVSTHYDNKKDLRKSYLNAAIIDWKQSYETAQKRGSTILPLDAYLISHARILDAISKKKTSMDELKKMLEEERKIWDMWLQVDKETKNGLKNTLKNNNT